jgi:hypothetical protein
MNEKDKLEKFILQNRDDFDQERPSFKVWADIEGSLQKNRNVRPLRWLWSTAAAVLLLLGMGIGLMVYPKIYEYQELQAYNQSKDLEGVEHYFNGEVDALLVELSGDPQVNNLTLELRRIDTQIATLKEDLAQAPKKSKEKIYEAIIATFEAKIELLQTAVSREKEIKIIKDEVQHI